jgi:hypothetical protein
MTAVENVTTFHDLHATMLHLLGLNHKQLTYRHAGRDFRLTDVYGNVLHDLIAYSLAEYDDKSPCRSHSARTRTSIGHRCECSELASEEVSDEQGIPHHY